MVLTGYKLIGCTIVNPAEHLLHHKRPQHNIQLRMNLDRFFNG